MAEKGHSRSSGDRETSHGKMESSPEHLALRHGQYLTEQYVERDMSFEGDIFRHSELSRGELVMAGLGLIRATSIIAASSL